MVNCHISRQSILSERGQKILAASQKLFLLHGYEETSLEMIINEAGGSRRSIYSEFGNKEGLLKAVIKSRISAQIDVLTTVDYQLPAEQALKQVCFKFVQGFVSETMLSLFRLITQVVVKLPEIGELIFNEGPMKGTAPLSEYLEHLHNEKVLNIDDKQYAAQMLIAMSKGRLHLQALLMPKCSLSDEQIAAQTDRAVDLFMKAYRVD